MAARKWRTAGRRQPAALAAGAAAIALIAAPSPRAVAAADLQLFRATLSPSGTVVNLTEAGPLDWAHWGYQMPAQSYGDGDLPVTNRKRATGDPPPIGSLQILPPATAPPPQYWHSVQSTTMSFRWSDGAPVLDPGAGAVVAGIGAIPESKFTLGVLTGPELRQLSIYISADCATEFPQVDAALGSLTSTLTSGQICLHQTDKDHKITVRFSSNDANPPALKVTVRSSFLDDNGPMIFAATLAAVGAGGSSAGDAGAPDGAVDRTGGGGSGAGGSASGAGGSGGVTGSGGAGDPGQVSGGRVLACAVAASVRQRPAADALALGLGLLWLRVRRRGRSAKQRPADVKG